MFNRLTQAALFVALTFGLAQAQAQSNVSTVVVPANGMLMASSALDTVNNLLAPGAAGFNFSGASGSFSLFPDAGGDYYSDYLLSVSQPVSLQVTTETQDNFSGVAGFSERLYAYAGSFLNGVALPAALTAQVSDITALGLTVSSLAAQSLAAGSYVLEVSGTSPGNYGASVAVTPLPVPEPSSLLLLLAGLAGLAGAVWRQRRT